jgi:predicted RNA binding protein YcfA (HicA-like mRNA interferase family)
VLSAGEVCRILQQNGFHQARQSGSHIVMKKPTSEGERVAIVPNHREIRQGTLKSIIAQSGLDRDLFE